MMMNTHSKGASASMQEVHHKIADNFNIDMPNPTVAGNPIGRITPFDLDKLTNSQEVMIPS